MWTIDVNHTRPPVAYITIEDGSTRADITAVLEHAGWLVVSQPTGIHVLQAIADVIDGRYTWLDPMLIVIDAHARGCAGTTIAAGLRDLGISIPIVLITQPGQRLPVTNDPAVRIVEARRAVDVVADLVGDRADCASATSAAHTPALALAAKPSRAEPALACEPAAYAAALRYSQS